MKDVLRDITLLDNVLQKKFVHCILSVEMFKDIMNKKQYELLQFSFLDWLMEYSSSVLDDNEFSDNNNTAHVVGTSVEGSVGKTVSQQVATEEEICKDQINSPTKGQQDEKCDEQDEDEESKR